MTRSNHEERFADDLQAIAEVLRDRRPSLDPLQLDQVKLRAMRSARSESSRARRFSMRSRLTTIVAAAFLVLGGGGAFALSGGGGGGGGGSASFSQYCEHNGKSHECHKGEEKREEKREEKEKHHKGK